MEETLQKSLRKFRSADIILKLIRDQVQSGQSIKSFCARQGLVEGTFHYWKKKYAYGDDDTRPGSARKMFEAIKIEQERFIGNIRTKANNAATDQ